VKQLWQRWSERIDAMSLRERAIVFAAAAAALVFLPYALAIRPALEDERRLARQLGVRMAALPGGDDPLRLVVIVGTRR